MYKALRCVLCACAIMLSAQLTAGLAKIGDFTIDQKLRNHKFTLDDGNTYRPVNKEAEEKMKGWQLGDTIMILGYTNKKHRFLLVNKSRNSRAAAFITSN